MAGIFVRDGERYVAMTEAPFDAEAVLQQLIAQHPQVLVDERGGQPRLLLLEREAGLGDDPATGSRFSLDHLFLDARGVPTLVEVKRSSDTRGRREVVAQMLDYAVRLADSYPLARITELLEAAAAGAGRGLGEHLEAELGAGDPDAFLALVGANLEVERLRLVFVSDRIHPDLERIISFLDRHLDAIAVTAIEVRQYVDADGHHQTIVPRIITSPTAVGPSPRPRARSITPAQLTASLEEHHAGSSAVLLEILAWATSREDLKVHWNTRSADIRLRDGAIVLRAWNDGSLELHVDTLHRREPNRWDHAAIAALLSELEMIPGVTFTRNRQRWPRTPLAGLAAPDDLQRFLSAVATAVT
ncbi:hypothetical protein GKE82_24230 [Conexibacter sp. W3-3-2]|uniref:hypothetical protein n=1 Tax=Conexibacter sp. W3-3-2 TaxID=2675227 RepID=UPI0012B7A28B|nr:hypothetical protein [Conexibacter sp. W3-3-2]MTD47317.1 hypothetical protein [Conexibacter sp. W3-3-2]